VIVGVDTHAETHHAAVIDLHGRHLADHGFPTTIAGYQQLLDWATGLGCIDTVGVELTGSYGAALTRHLTAAGVTVREVNTTDKATRARRGKDDRIDAYAAAEKVLAGMATAIPKDTTGSTEAIRILTLTRDSAVTARSKTWNQLHAVLVTAPAALRDQFRDLSNARLKTVLAQLETPSTAHTVTTTTITVLRRLANRIITLSIEIDATDHDLDTLVAATAPTLLSRPGIGTHTAARFLICVADNGNADPLRSSPRPPHRRLPRPGLFRENKPDATQPRRRPESELRPPHRHHQPTQIRPNHPRLPRPNPRPRTPQPRRHPITETSPHPSHLPRPQNRRHHHLTPLDIHRTIQRNGNDLW